MSSVQVGAFAIHASLLEDESLTEDARKSVEAMLASVMRMSAALAAITSRFGLEVGDTTPLARIDTQARSSHRAPR